MFEYDESKISLTGELSNELLYKFPEKIIVIARKHNGKMKTSFRSRKDVDVRELVKQAIVGINGRHGGHVNACGGEIDSSDWHEFLNNLRKVA